MARVDIQIKEDRELVIANGDFVADSSDNQHVQLIFEAQKGELRHAPYLGFGAGRYLKKTNTTEREFLRNLKVELEKDGYKSPEITIDFELNKIMVDVK